MAAWPLALAALVGACGDHRARAIDLVDAPGGDPPADAAADGPIDGALPGGPMDAPSDAQTDAAIDAPPDAALPDAPPPDAPPPDAPPPDAPPPPVLTVRLADVVVAAPGATGTGFGDPARAVNGVRGTGDRSGSLDVFSLGYQVDRNDYITLRWSNARLRNGPGADFAVFENAFLVGATGTFMDLVIVEVSLDGAEFRALPHRYTAPDPRVYRNTASLWSGFAGRTPVRLHAETNPVDPFDTTAAGGDAFDLDNLPGDDDIARAIRADGVRFVRLVSASARVNPDTGANYVRESISNGPDIDGMYGRYLETE